MNTNVLTNSNSPKTNIHTNANINANPSITTSYKNTGTVLLLAIPNTNIHNFWLIRKDISTSVQFC